MNPKKLFAFEPNPASIELLLHNITLNNLDVDLRGIGLGLGAKNGRYSVVMPPDNMGAARLISGGPIQVTTLDAVMTGVHIDFIKIDVEGMELEVLEGGCRTIARSRPILLVEVSNSNLRAFHNWMEHVNYRAAAIFPYVNARNYLIEPCSRSRALG